MIKDNWKKEPIKNSYLEFYDGPHATPPPSDHGPVYLGIKNIREDGSLDLSEIRHISEKDYSKWIKRVEPRSGDIVFTYEATLNRYAIIPKGFKGCLGRRLALIRPNPNEIDTRYLFYYFFSEEWRQTISNKMISGSTVDRIPIIDFPNFEIRKPSLKIQRKISSILSAYDDLIDNNTRRIQILEEMAQRIYREWFVHFRFPGHENVKMVDSELGIIPEGWEVKELGETVTFRRGKNITKKEMVEGEVPVVAAGINPAFYHNQANVTAPAATISASGANAGFIRLYLEDIWASDCSYINKEETENIFYTFSLIKDRQVEITGLQRGSAQPHVYPMDIMQLKVINPKINIKGYFERVVEPIFKTIGILQEKKKILERTRDLLLPKLISGKIDVSNLDINLN